MKIFRDKKNFLIVGGIILLLSLVFLYKNNFSLKNPTFNIFSKKDEAVELAREVGKIMFLPQDEIPTVATVLNPEDLQGQIFFIDAKIGDKVLIYRNVKKAILYDPSAHKIITIAPLILGDEGVGSKPGLSTPVLKY